MYIVTIVTIDFRYSRKNIIVRIINWEYCKILEGKKSKREFSKFFQNFNSFSILLAMFGY